MREVLGSKMVKEYHNWHQLRTAQVQISLIDFIVMYTVRCILNIVSKISPETCDKQHVFES